VLKSKSFVQILFLLLLVILPWFIFSGNDYISPEKITSDLKFYEINTCSIPLGNFLLENINVIYQDHYKIRANNYSSIKCFGQITGIDQINDIFYISIGTNSLVNLSISGLFFYLSLNFIPRFKTKLNISLRKLFLTSLISPLIMIIGILGQQRYYEKSLYIYDLSNYWNILNLYLILFVLSNLYLRIFQEKFINLIIYSPYIYIFIGIISGFNLSLIIFLLINIGLYYFIENIKILRKSLLYVILMVSFWIFNFYLIGEKGYYLKPDKLMGLIFTQYNQYSIFYTSSTLFLLVVGIKFLTTQANLSYDLKTFSRNLIISANGVFTIGFLSANFPLLNFLSKYFLGPQKNATDQIELFKFNEWNVLVPWRGFYPSAESVGEFYALSILIFIYFMIKNQYRNFKYSEILYLFLPILGLVLSNNRAAIILLFTPLVYLVLKNVFHKVNVYYAIALSLFSIVLIRNNINISSNKIKQNLDSYNNEITISELGNFIVNSDSLFMGLLINFYSVVSTLINRSELWSIFIVKYNPNLLETFFGSGPYNLSKYYSEIKIEQLSGLVLPHSSMLNLIIFFGLFNTLFLCFLLIKKVTKYNYENDLFSIFLTIFLAINLIKSDSILYLSSLIFYLIINYLDFNSQKGS